MRLRPRIHIALVGAGALLIVGLIATMTLLRGADETLRARKDAQEVSRQAAGLLAMTQEYTLSLSEDSATLWRARQRRLAASVREARDRWGHPELVRLDRAMGAVAPVFELLAQGSGDLPAVLAERRRTLLIERLVAQTQSAAEVAYRWSVDLTEDEAMQLQQLTWASIGLETGQALVVGALALLLLRGVLGRLTVLHGAADAIRRGDLDVRCAVAGDDELGDTARAVDAMATELQQQRAVLATANAQLQEQIALRTASQQRLQLLVDTLPAQVSLWRRDGTNLMANRRLESALALPAGGLAGRRYGDITPRAGGEPLLPARSVDRVLAGEKVEIEHPWPHGDGPGCLLLTLVPERDELGQVQAFLVHGIDITERRRLERRVADSERFLRAVTDTTPLQLAYLDADGVVRFANAPFCAALHRLREDVLDRPWHELMPAHRVALFDGAVREALSGSRRRVEYDGPNAHGDSRSWESLFVPAVLTANAQGPAVHGCHWIISDTTERRRSEGLLARVAEVAPSGMLLIAGDRRVRFANARAGALFGCDPHTLVGVPVQALVPADAVQDQEAIMRRFFQGGRTKPLRLRRDLRALRRDGSTIDVEVGLSRLDTAEGPAVLVVVNDVSTDRAQKRRLEASLGERETLLREIYHRVKNNLQLVQSLLRLQRRLLPEGPARAALEESARRVRAMALVHERLYQSGSLSAVPLRAYTTDLLQHSGDAAGAGTRTISLRADVLEMDANIESAIPYGLLVTELVGNSLKHAFQGRGSGTVTVTLARVDGTLRLSVTDDGIGLPADFDLNSLRSMGLPLAHALAAQLGGELKANHGSGTSFVTDVPRLG